jgi:tRNA pseudouridine38-40 synthase
MFQAAGSTEKETTVRTVENLSIRKEADEIIIEITGDGFLYNMVRIITGTLVDVGHGKISPLEIP